jgi:hypothetical protein
VSPPPLPPAPAITSAASATFNAGSFASFTFTADVAGPAMFLPEGT